MKRRVLSIVTVLVLCTAVVAGATLAYLNKMEEKSNPFIYDTDYDPTNPDSPKAFDGELREPLWSAADQFKGETPMTLPAGEKYGEVAAKDFLPGRKINKNPILKNTGTKHDIYVGMIVECDATSTLTLGELEGGKLISVNYNTTDWEEVTPSGANPDKRYFIYRHTLAKGEKTTPLFTHVTIGKNTDSLLPTDKWNLTVHSYITQAENDLYGDGWTPRIAIPAQYSTSYNSGFADPDVGGGHWNAITVTMPPELP